MEFDPCEWNSEHGREAYCGEPCNRFAEVSVGDHHLCRDCAALPRFAGKSSRELYPERMSLGEFRERFDHAPWDDDRLISACLQHLNPNEPLRIAAAEMSTATKSWESALRESGLELG